MSAVIRSLDQYEPITAEIRTAMIEKQTWSPEFSFPLYVLRTFQFDMLRHVELDFNFIPRPFLGLRSCPMREIGARAKVFPLWGWCSLRVILLEGDTPWGWYSLRAMLLSRHVVWWSGRRPGYQLVVFIICSFVQSHIFEYLARPSFTVLIRFSQCTK